MTTKAQRLRVAELLDGLACQEDFLLATSDVLDEDDDALACAAYESSVRVFINPCLSG